MSRRRITRIIALAAIAAGTIAATGACDPAPKPYAAVWGDSLMVQTSNALAFGLHNDGYDHTNINAFGGVGPCDWWPSIQQAIKSNPKPTIAVLEFAGNNYTSCVGIGKTGAALDGQYEHDLAIEVSSLTKAGIRTYVLSTPTLRGDAHLAHPDMSSPALMDAERAATTIGGGHWLDSAGQQSSPVENANGSFIEVAPCLSWETGSNCGTAGAGFNTVRAPDGIHFCPGQSGGANGTVPNDCPVYDSGATRYGLYTALAIGRP